MLGALGFVGGWLLSLYDSPERATRDVIVFSLTGAVLGSMLTGWKFGLVGKSSAAGLIIGAFCGWSGNYPKFSQELPWAIAGYLIGFTIGLILEYIAVEQDGSNSQPEPSALRNEPSSQ